MKKTHWLRATLITLVACGLAGLLLAVILFQSDGGRTGATAGIQFSFDGAAQGMAPNGYRFDLSGFTSDEVIRPHIEYNQWIGRNRGKYQLFVNNENQTEEETAEIIKGFITRLPEQE